MGGYICKICGRGWESHDSLKLCCKYEKRRIAQSSDTESVGIIVVALLIIGFLGGAFYGCSVMSDRIEKICTRHYEKKMDFDKCTEGKVPIEKGVE
jgi:hypothetical protein